MNRDIEWSQSIHFNVSRPSNSKTKREEGKEGACVTNLTWEMEGWNGQTCGDKSKVARIVGHVYIRACVCVALGYSDSDLMTKK